MNSLPYLTLLVTELASRDPAYDPVLEEIKTLVAQGLHSGAINRRVYLNMAGYQIENLDIKETSKIVQEIDDSLSASLVNCVGKAADAHKEISKLREKLKQATG